MPDKYDHNCFEYSGQPSLDEFIRALAYQKDRNAGFIKLKGDAPLSESFGLEAGITLTMILGENHGAWKTNAKLS